MLLKIDLCHMDIVCGYIFITTSETCVLLFETENCFFLQEIQVLLYVMRLTID